MLSGHSKRKIPRANSRHWTPDFSKVRLQTRHLPEAAHSSALSKPFATRTARRVAATSARGPVEPAEHVDSYDLTGRSEQPSVADSGLLNSSSL